MKRCPSEKILQKAQQEQAKEFYQQILDRLEDLPSDTPDWRDALKSAIDDIMQAADQQQTEEQTPMKKDVWDFSREKSGLAE